MLGLAFVETGRFCLLRKIRKQVAEGRKEYREALDLQLEEEETGSLQAKLLIVEKYSDLRKMTRTGIPLTERSTATSGGWRARNTPSHSGGGEEGGDDGGLGSIGKL